ncbi:MAG: DUF1697 domain-containing protein [Armatimonadetes bacterium]|nr:DUF1697 domain-containing protein [Armatimonadota bacterium]
MRTTTRPYLALLRGINVGGKNLVRMDELRRCFEELGLWAVSTYIQSGNVLFRSAASIPELVGRIEPRLTSRFSYTARVVVLSYDDYRACLAAAPDSWGRDESWKHNALYTLPEVDARDLLALLPAPRPELETVTAAPGALFWSASKQHLARTTMMKLAGLPAYKSVTIRNHNTTFKLLKLLEEL